MHWKRRDNRTRMQRKADRRNTIATSCMFAFAVFAFSQLRVKITTPKLKSQESALKCETEAK